MEYKKQNFQDRVVDASGNVITEGTTLCASHLNYIEDGIDYIINGTKCSFVTGKYIEQYSGTVTSNADWNYCETYFDVTPGDIITFEGVSTGGNMVIYYDSNKNRVANGQGSLTYTTPTGVSYMRINVHKNYVDAVSLVVAGKVIIGTGVFERLEKLEKVDTNANSSSGTKNFHVGSSYEFKRLRDGIAEAVKYPYSTVYVHSGVYDLSQEFATEIANESGKGIGLKNNVHVIFERGAYVKALFDNSSNWVYTWFEPFYAVETDGGFTLENLDIEASNTRYCVHDEHNGNHKYINKYINCRMKYTNTHSNVSYVQCIGGGTGENCTIVIDGGYYESSTTHGYSTYGTYGTPENCQQPISYHNGNRSECDNRIIIKNVYLANRGYFRFGNHGPSTLKSHIEVSNCSTGLPILNMFETTGSSPSANFDILAFNNTVREEKVPFDFSRVINIIED